MKLLETLGYAALGLFLGCTSPVPHVEFSPEGPSPPQEQVLLTIHYKVVEATGYTIGKESCGRFADGLTCHNDPVITYVTMATDSRVFPHHRWYYVQGINDWRLAEDHGGAIRGARIDLLFLTKTEARKFGRRKVVVTW